ncbi:hypothetical protein V5049_13425 [Moellerella wisconsensis]|uniref:hypothetical protein n=1 Tax=Moellerella wisconsensis TaxID=158849 RepID=UPI0030763725
MDKKTLKELAAEFAKGIETEANFNQFTDSGIYTITSPFITFSFDYFSYTFSPFLSIFYSSTSYHRFIF